MILLSSVSFYQYFFRDQRLRYLETVEQQKEGEDSATGGTESLFSSMAREISKQWKETSLQARMPYQEMAQKDKLRYDREMQDHKQSRTKEAKSPSQPESKKKPPPTSGTLQHETEHRRGEAETKSAPELSSGQIEGPPGFCPATQHAALMLNPGMETREAQIDNTWPNLLYGELRQQQDIERLAQLSSLAMLELGLLPSTAARPMQNLLAAHLQNNTANANVSDQYLPPPQVHMLANADPNNIARALTAAHYDDLLSQSRLGHSVYAASAALLNSSADGSVFSGLLPGIETPALPAFPSSTSEFPGTAQSLIPEQALQDHTEQQEQETDLLLRTFMRSLPPSLAW